VRRWKPRNGACELIDEQQVLSNQVMRWQNTPEAVVGRPRAYHRQPGGTECRKRAVRARQRPAAVINW
jgi:hypothetical protein